MAPPKKAKKPDPKDDAAAASPPNSNVVDGVSPPGMRMRSGKKKRRRSVEEKKEREPDPKRKRLVVEEDEGGEESGSDEADVTSTNDAVMDEAADVGGGGGGDDEDDDESMKSEEDGKMPAEDVQQPQKPSNGRSSRREPQNQHQEATTTSAAAATATAAAAPRGGQQRVPPVEKLRMPSQQTPARIMEKERKRAAAAAAAAASSSTTQQEEEIAPAGTRKLNFVHKPEAQQPSTINASEPPKIERGGGPVLENGGRTPQEEEQQQQRFEEHELEEVVQPSSLSSVGVWCLIWLTLAIVCYLLFPIRSAFVEFPGNFLMGKYQSLGLLGQPEDIHDVERRLIGKLETYNTQNSLLEGYEGKFASNLEEIQEDRQLFQNRLKKRKQELTETTPKVDSLVKLLESVLEKGVMGSGSLNEARDVLGDEDPLLDLSFIEDWNLPETAECTHPSEVGLGEFVTRVEELKEKAMGSAQKSTENPVMEELVRKWLRDSILDEVPGYESIIGEIAKSDDDNEETKTVVDADADDTTRTALKRASLEEIQKTIAARFELERADQTGRFDYASVLNGATVIRTGDRATTASLVETLPVLNRMAALLSLRFYGYGPEAAITPTHPPTALGQCWAFPSHVDKKNSVLSVQLAKPIRVQRISIEHPPMEISDRTDSAIRTFQVIGFEDTGAEGKPWVLGSFEYKRGHSFRQEFQAADHDKGEKVPVLRSISLSIFSNWGMEYSCLYRVRVFGRES